MKMAHTCIRVQNLNDSLDFYQTAFGFQEVSKRDFPEHKFTLVYLSLPNDSYTLELTYNYDHAAYDIGNGYGHIAISTKDINRLHQEHQLAGLNITELKGLPGTAPSYYFVTDPDGYKIEVIIDRS